MLGQTGYNAARTFSSNIVAADTGQQQNSRILYHQVSWTVTNAPASCTFAVDSSPDGVTWTAGGIITSTTCTAATGTTAITNVSATYIRLNVIALTTASLLTLNYIGWTVSPGSVATTGGNNTFTGSNTFTGLHSLSNLNNLQIMDGVKYPLTDVGLQAALTAAGSNGVVLIPPNTAVVISNTVTSTANYQSIVGWGMGSTITVNLVGDVLEPRNIGFQLRDVTVAVTTTSTRTGAIIHPNVAAANVGYIYNVIFSGNTTSTNNGYGLLFDTPPTSIWTIDSCLFIGTNTTWTAAVKAVSSSASTISDLVITNLTSQSLYSDAGLVFDGSIDTVQLRDIDMFPASSTTEIWARNTVAAPISPRWIRNNGGGVEGGGAAGGTAIKLDAVRSFVYTGYVASSTIGVTIGANADGVDFHDTIFTNIGNSAITVAAGAINTSITNNSFEDCGVTTTNTYICVSVAANVTDINVSSNAFRVFTQANLPTYAVFFASGTGARIKAIANDIPSTSVGTGGIGWGGLSGGDVNVFANPVGNTNNQLINNWWITQEGGTPAGLAGQDQCYGDSTAHALKCSYNNGSFYNVPLVGIANTWTANQTFNVGTFSGSNAPTIIVLTSQYTNSTTGFTNVAGGNTIQFPVLASTNYTATCHLYYQSTALGGLNIEFTGPASPTSVTYGLSEPTALGTTDNSVATAYSTSLGNVIVTAATNFDATVSFSLINGTTAGTVNLLAKASTAVQVQIQAGSYCQVQ